jgi:transcription elongation factor Elf1
MSNLYALVEVKIAGVMGHARPAEFDYDEKGQPKAIKKIVTTCPKCSAFNEYVVNIEDNSGVFVFQCSSCEKSAEQVNDVEISESRKDVLEIISKDDSDFVDPIELGLFNVEQI